MAATGDLFGERVTQREERIVPHPRIGGLSRAAKSERDRRSSYQTPPALVARIRTVLGGIQLDPCTNPSNPCAAERFYTPSDDGILQPWDAETIFINPPYGRTIGHWVRKALDAQALGARVILLVPSRTDTRWFQGALQCARAALFMSGRLKFLSADGLADVDAPFPSVMLAYNCDIRSLRDLGAIVVATPS
jgi:phage N-6-adenine-methyltransferase